MTDGNLISIYSIHYSATVAAIAVVEIHSWYNTMLTEIKSLRTRTQDPR